MDTDHSAISTIIDGMKYVIVTAVGVIGVLLARVFRRNDARLEEMKKEISKRVLLDTFNETMKATRDYIRESTERIERSIEGHNDKLEHVTQRIDRIIESKICHHSQKDHSKD